MNNLAEAFVHQGNYKEAEEIQRRTLDLSQKVLVKEHDYISGARQSLTNTLASRGQFVDAKKMHREVLVRHQKIFEANHQEIVTSMIDMASVLSRGGNNEEAEELYLRKSKNTHKVDAFIEPMKVT